MRKILKGLLGVPLIAFALLATGLWLVGGFILRAREGGRVSAFAGSVFQENSPVVELATRKIVWKVTQVVSSLSKDVVRETVFTVKAGYDMSDAAMIVSGDAKTVELRLPPPKIISVDHLLQRASAERRTLVERVFGSNVDDGQADREDVIRLAADCEKYNLLSTADLRESIERFVADRVRELGGYRLVLDNGYEIPAKAMFNAYFEEKGVGFRLP